MTNFDVIFREAMISGFARVIANTLTQDNCYGCQYKHICGYYEKEDVSDYDCAKAMEAWLREEVEDDNGEDGL